jgi:hypothetical protein
MFKISKKRNCSHSKKGKEQRKEERKKKLKTERKSVSVIGPIGVTHEGAA